MSTKTGIDLIRAERRRQQQEEGWSKQHDREVHGNGELARAAAVYAIPTSIADDLWRRIGNRWLWPAGWAYRPVPNDRVRELMKAGALIAAEIDRLLALEPKTP
jgi:hypothetical protein